MLLFHMNRDYSSEITGTDILIKNIIIVIIIVIIIIIIKITQCLFSMTLNCVRCPPLGVTVTSIVPYMDPVPPLTKLLSGTSHYANGSNEASLMRRLRALNATLKRSDTRWIFGRNLLPCAYVFVDNYVECKTISIRGLLLDCFSFFRTAFSGKSDLG